MLLEVEYECFLKYYHVPKDGQLLVCSIKAVAKFFAILFYLGDEQWIEKQNVEVDQAALCDHY